jgi:hypothetical protein
MEEDRMVATTSAAQALTAFCATCPAPEAVTTLLHGLGLRLDFQLGAVHYAAYQQLPDLPAQFHYRSSGGDEVLYLAGQDSPLDGERFPRHASRFWAYAGSDAQMFRHLISALSARWLLTWQRLDHVPSQHTNRVALDTLGRKAVPA